jgi:hypothetical protein
LTGRKWGKGKDALEPVILKSLEALAAVQSIANRAPTRIGRRNLALAKAAKQRQRD